MTIYVRRTRKEDLKRVMQIIHQATLYLAEQDSPQWQNGFAPTEKMILSDMNRNESYVLILDGTIVATASLVSGIDPVYTAIDGYWQSQGKADYLSIHRVAVDTSYRGKKLAKQLLLHLLSIAQEKGFDDVRIDTYPKNIPMEKTIFSAGFHYQGMVEFPIPEGIRKAYQIILI